MTLTLSVKQTSSELEKALAQLQLGDTITLTDSAGKPLAVVVSVEPTPKETENFPAWQMQWDGLTQKISRAWQSEKSASQILAEMRR